MHDRCNCIQPNVKEKQLMLFWLLDNPKIISKPMNVWFYQCIENFKILSLRGGNILAVQVLHVQVRFIIFFSFLNFWGNYP